MVATHVVGSPTVEAIDQLPRKGSSPVIAERIQHGPPLRIALIASSRFPIAQPFVGGLEAHIWGLSRALRDRGHHVTLFAAAGSDAAVADRIVPFPPIHATESARRDVSEDAELVAAEDAAYRAVITDLIGSPAGRFDLVHNHSLHPTPLAAADRLPIPMIATFHTPPFGRLSAALSGASRRDLCLVAVSAHAARAWSELAGAVHVVHNGVDTRDWVPGPGGGRLIWFGRLVPEKGADLAIAAARRAGRPLDLAGPVIDEDYFRDRIAPELGPDVRYLGHLEQDRLAAAVGRAAAALVTPRWDEPYGLVVAEALACGTPVAAFARGGIPEIVSPQCGRLAPGDDVDALSEAVQQAVNLDRDAVRRHAARYLSMARMVGAYEDLYRSRVAERSSGRTHGALAVRHIDGALAQAHGRSAAHLPGPGLRVASA